MSNTRFIPTNILKTATLTGNQHADSDLNNIIDYRRFMLVNGEPDISYPTPPYSAVPNLEVLCNWEGLQRASAINIDYYNLHFGATVQLILYLGNNQTGDVVYDSGELGVIKYKTFFELDQYIDNMLEPVGDFDNLGKNLFFEFQTTLFLSAKIIIKNAENPTGYITLNHIFLGELLTTTKNIDWSVNLTRTDSTEHIQLQDGGYFHNVGTNGYNIECSYSRLQLSDRNLIFKNIVVKNGSSVPFFCDIMPCSSDSDLTNSHRGVFFIQDDVNFGLSNQFLTDFKLKLTRV